MRSQAVSTLEIFSREVIAGAPTPAGPEELAALVRQKGQNLKAITAAQGEFTNEDFAHIDALIFKAFDSERVVGGIPPEAVQAIGQYILTAITRIFTEQAQKEQP